MNQLSKLLAKEDREFVDSAYAELLGRPVDASGANHFLCRLRGGVSKLQILGEISGSPEGRARRAYLPGLRLAVAKDRLARLPLIGPIVGALLGVEGDTAAERRVRALEQHFHVTIGELDNAVRQLETAVARMARSAGLLDREGPHGPRETAADAVDGVDGGAKVATPPGGGLGPSYVPSVEAAERAVYVYVGHTVKYPLNTGVQRVTRRLAFALSEASDRVHFVDWDDERQCLVFISRGAFASLARWGGLEAPEPGVGPYREDTADRQPIPFHTDAKGNWLLVPEVTHITFNSEPVTAPLIAEARRKGLLTAFLFYDATPLCRAELGDMAIRHAAYMELLSLVDLILPISEAAGADLRAFHRVHDRGGASTLPPVRPMPLPGESPLGGKRARPERSGAGEPLILSVGSITRHKNQLALIHAFENLCRSGPRSDWRLVLIGGVDAHLEEDLACVMATAERTRVIRSASDEVLDKYYRRCAFTVFPSVEEGFGLPIVESLWYGRPCVCANFGAMGEVAAGGGCLTTDMRDSAALARTLATLIDSPAQLDLLCVEAAGRPLATWSDYAGRLLREMDEVASPFRALGPVYFWVDHTVRSDANSGIQRVVRGLARALLDLGAELVPVAWNAGAGRLRGVGSRELEHLARWNGPDVLKWQPWREPEVDGGWLLVPELTSFLTTADRAALDVYVAGRRMRRAQIFFDAIPCKYPDLYAPDASAAHAAYMEGLNCNDLVLAISEFAFQDLAGFLERRGIRAPGLYERMMPCLLPGEFMEGARITAAKPPDPQVVRILCVASVEARKNHLVLLAAFDSLLATSGTRVELVLAGSGTLAPALASHVEAYAAREPRLRWVRSPDDAALRRLYDDCDFTVCASYEEGFGLPILESLWHARPCVCASFGAMAEVARGGGCLLTDVRDVERLAAAITRLVTDSGLRERLAREAACRPIRNWRHYATEVAARMQASHVPAKLQPREEAPDRAMFYARFVNLKPRPRLSVCVSTFNRADWLALCLRAIERAWPTPCAEVELLVCDNASTDHTPEVMQRFADRGDLRYLRNPENVGMLGNLRVTAQAARGEYVWIIGDDDVLIPGAIERVLKAAGADDNPALVYLNYAHTRAADAGAIADLDAFIAAATPAVEPGPDQAGPVRDICANSENFFTAIYCLVFRRDHALQAYSQCTEGAPFSTMQTAIPTTRHVLTRMMDEPGFWIGAPALVANMNVSWSRHAPLFVLERFPEARDLAERLGGDPARIDHWRRHACPLMFRFFSLIFEPDYEAEWDHLSVRRILSRLRGFDGVEPFVTPMLSAYRAALERGHPAARLPVEEVFVGFGGDARAATHG